MTLGEQEQVPGSSTPQQKEVKHVHSSRWMVFPWLKVVKMWFAKHQLTVPVWVYGVLFVIADFTVVTVLQVGVQYSDGDALLTAWSRNVFALVKKMWEQLNFILLLNLLLVALLYVILIMLTNRFWMATLVLFIVALFISVINLMKVGVRGETIQPADFNFLGSDAGNITSFLPRNAGIIIGTALLISVVAVLMLVFLHLIDANHGKIVRFKRLRWNYLLRIVVSLIVGALFATYVATVATVGSVARTLNNVAGDWPAMWDSAFDAQLNGTLVSFLRQVNPKVMDKPEDYSEETMKQVLARYQRASKQINSTRKANMTDTTVVFVLSESFADPTRVPGILLNQNPIPFINSIKERTDSGLMLSSGYGGGTANLEYMALSGLSMANFNPSLTSPYQQLVQKSSWVPTINQYWGNGQEALAYHPYYASMYLRGSNYRKFGFSKFYSLQGINALRYKDCIDSAIYVSDDSAYKNAMEGIVQGEKPKFVQLITMQNHLPFNNWYRNNEFVATSKDASAPLGSDETVSIQTYAKGVNYTDKATQQFLEGLDQLDKPVTVVFYGDHLPGIYTSASANSNNSLNLHLTDYFIWSNKKARDHVEKLKAKNYKDHKHIKTNMYSSPNFFISQVADHLNARVSPYLAFLTKLHERIPAMEPPVSDKDQRWERIPEGKPIYLNAQGKRIDTSTMDQQTQQLLHDYRLIQYDITAGKHYLRDTDFMTLPRK